LLNIAQVATHKECSFDFTKAVMASIPIDTETLKDDIDTFKQFLAKTRSLTRKLGSDEDKGRGTSTLPGTLEIKSFSENDLPLSEDELVRDHLESYHEKLSTYHPLINAVIGEPDFQPISFLQLGLDRGQSVCRILIYLSQNSLTNIVEKLISRISQLGEKVDLSRLQAETGFKPLEELKVAFSLPDNFFDEPDESKLPAEEMTYLDGLSFLSKNINELLKLNPFALGTGFLVGENYLLTNHHVLPDAATAQQCFAQFGYEGELRDCGISEYDFDPQSFFVSDPELDYTLIQLKPNPYSKRTAGYKFDWINLVESEELSAPPLSTAQSKQLFDELKKLGYGEEAIRSRLYPDPDDATGKLPGNRTAIIEHPRGRRKEIVLNNNIIVRKTFNNLTYTTDTDYGSSGSPVFNMNWQLIALNKRVVPKIVDKQEQSKCNQKKTAGEASFRFGAAEGTRIVRVIEDLKRKSVQDSRLLNFIENFVTTSEQLNYPPLPAALKFDGFNNCIDIARPSEETVNDFEEFSIEAWVNPCLSSTNITVFSQLCEELWYKDFEGDSVFGRYLLSFQITPEGYVVFSREPFWDASSIKYPDNGLVYPLLRLKKDQERRKHPLEVLAPKTTNPEAIISISTETETEANSTERIEALQSILYCLGFFSEKGCEEDYRKIYAEVVNGKLDADTRRAIESFNEWVSPDDPFIKILEDGKTITISSDAIGIFRRKGTYLGLGVIQKRKANEPEVHKDHYGLRVLELQHCLKSLDWDNSSLESSFKGQTSPINPNIQLNACFDWPPNPESLMRWAEDNAMNTTAYAVKKLQRAYCQCDEAVFSPLALAALEQEKSYEICAGEKLPVGEFSHIAVTLDKQKKVKLYINGQLANQQYVGNHSVGYIDKASIGAKISKLTSESNDKESRSAYLKGSMSEVRLWKTSLQKEDIKKRMRRRLNSNEIQDKNLTGYWRLEEGKIEGDQAESSPVYYIYNLATQGVSYESKSAFQVGGTTKSVSIQSAREFPTVPLPFGLDVTREPRLNIPSQKNVPIERGNPGITVECWAKLGYGDGKIISGGDSEKGSYTLSWMSGKIQLELLGLENLVTKIETQEAIPNPKIWHHIAFSWEATSKEVSLYLDGKLQNVIALQAQVTTLSSKTTYKSLVTFSPERFIVDEQTIRVLPKSQENNKVQNLCFSIAELRVWKVARSHSEIKTCMAKYLDQAEEATNGLVACWHFNGEESLSL
jgi:Trypsin-like peptidase domain/Concanavalin A-like lectin/glucanases superfamily